MTIANTLETRSRSLPFAREAMVRRVHAEGVLLLGGGRALLMQVAHPAVAKGVAEHSNFRGDRTGRLVRTLRPMLAIVFGTREDALAAARGVNRMHEGVAGAGYDAADPELLLWVFATLVDTALVMHERFLRPLTKDEATAYYEDMRHVGSLFGLPASVMPTSVDALRDYTIETSATLRVTSEAVEISRALFVANIASWPLMQSIRLLTAGLLPAPLREQYGFAWGPRREAAMERLAGGSRLVLPRLPRALRAPPWFLLP